MGERKQSSRPLNYVSSYRTSPRLEQHLTSFVRDEDGVEPMSERGQEIRFRAVSDLRTESKDYACLLALRFVKKQEIGQNLAGQLRELLYLEQAS